jgi:threonine synthase
LKVALEHRDAGIPLVCLETALPAKFEDAIQEALGRSPARPAGLEDLEGLPRRFTEMPADIEVVKAFVAAHADA